MKRILLFTLVCLSVILAKAQEPTDKPVFLTIKGVELTPTMSIKDMSDKLQAQGLHKDPAKSAYYEQQGMAYLEGPFFGNVCEFSLLPLQTNKSVLGIVGIALPKRKSFK